MQAIDEAWKPGEDPSEIRELTDEELHRHNLQYWGRYRGPPQRLRDEGLMDELRQVDPYWAEHWNDDGRGGDAHPGERVYGGYHAGPTHLSVARGAG
jgi:hypothetical protein